jgi:hypothetical protein
MTCRFCAKDTPARNVFIGVSAPAAAVTASPANCVLDLYVVMRAAGMRALERVRKTPRSAPGAANTTPGTVSEAVTGRKMGANGSFVLGLGILVPYFFTLGKQ